MSKPSSGSKLYETYDWGWILPEAAQRHSNGETIAALARQYDMPHATMRDALLRYRGKPGYSKYYKQPSDPFAFKAKAAALKARIPKDTRTISQILTGEPLPGRSALDRMEDSA